MLLIIAVTSIIVYDIYQLYIKVTWHDTIEDISINRFDKICVNKMSRPKLTGLQNILSSELTSSGFKEQRFMSFIISSSDSHVIVIPIHRGVLYVENWSPDLQRRKVQTVDVNVSVWPFVWIVKRMMCMFFVSLKVNIFPGLDVWWSQDQREKLLENVLHYCNDLYI